jgi:hypothetical protein
MRLCVILLLFVTIAVPTIAQDAPEEKPTGWTASLVGDMTAAQTAYSDSWDGGEAGSFTWVANVNGSAERNVKPWLNIKSTLRLKFGQTLTQDAETKKWSRPQKSNDLIDWETVGLFDIHDFVEPYAAFRLESQFVNSTVRQLKRYFNPVKLTESAGIARVFHDKDKDKIMSRLGLGLRQIMKSVIVGDTALLQTEDSTLIDGGIESVTDATLTFNDRLVYTSKLTMYKAFYFSEKDAVAGTIAEDYWKAVDINWENTLNASITKIVTVSFYTQVLYDKEVSLKGRFKETLGIGLTVKLM